MARLHEDRIQDILAAIQIIDFAEKSFSRLDSIDLENKIPFSAILYQLLVIGEAVKFLNEDFKLKYSDIPWDEISGMRDILAHDYFNLDIAIIRATIDAPLKALATICQLNT